MACWLIAWALNAVCYIFQGRWMGNRTKTYLPLNGPKPCWDPCNPSHLSSPSQVMLLTVCLLHPFLPPSSYFPIFVLQAFSTDATRPAVACLVSRATWWCPPLNRMVTSSSQRQQQQQQEGWEGSGKPEPLPTTSSSRGCKEICYSSFGSCNVRCRSIWLPRWVPTGCTGLPRMN